MLLRLKVLKRITLSANTSEFQYYCVYLHVLVNVNIFVCLLSVIYLRHAFCGLSTINTCVYASLSRVWLAQRMYVENLWKSSGRLLPQPAIKSGHVCAFRIICQVVATVICQFEKKTREPCGRLKLALRKHDLIREEDYSSQLASSGPTTVPAEPKPHNPHIDDDKVETEYFDAVDELRDVDGMLQSPDGGVCMMHALVEIVYL